MSDEAEHGGGAGQDTMWILDPAQLRCLASSTRMDIVDHLAGRGALSIAELAKALGRQPSSLYHHLEKLLQVGMVVETGSRVTNRRSEKVYATPSRRMRLQRALADPANAEVMQDVVQALSRQAQRDFAAGQSLPGACADGAERNLGFFRLVARPDAEALARINGLLAEVGETMWEEAPGDSPAITLTWVMAPCPE